jgi:hypothetical protein
MKKKPTKKPSKASKTPTKKSKKGYVKPQLKKEGDLFKKGWGESK